MGPVGKTLRAVRRKGVELNGKTRAATSKRNRGKPLNEHSPRLSNQNAFDVVRARKRCRVYCRRAPKI